MSTANNEDDGYEPKPKAVGVAAVAAGSAGWSPECPVREGYYWCSRWDDIMLPFIVWVRAGRRGENVHVFTLGWHRHTDPKFAGALWHGPITQPPLPNNSDHTRGS